MPQKFKHYNPIDGILIVDKPQAWTSHDVCAFVRKRFKIKKVGHAGTLDPIATGLLVLLLGKATKQSLLLTTVGKQYEGTMQLGLKTDSHDLTGKVTGEAPWNGITLEDIRRHARSFTGDIEQVPPMVSALKHQGVRLYKLARKGQEVPRESRKITVYQFEFHKQADRFVSFTVRVSKGTYVRTLIHDLGESLGCFAALQSLRRTQSGGFDLSQSVTLDQLRTMEVTELRNRIFPLSCIAAYANSHST